MIATHQGILAWASADPGLRCGLAAALIVLPVVLKLLMKPVEQRAAPIEKPSRVTTARATGRPPPGDAVEVGAGVGARLR